MTKILTQRAHSRWRLVGGVFAALICTTSVALLTSAHGNAFRAGQSPSQNAAVALGELLFNSPLLSKDSTVSCATCHIKAFGFSGDRPIAVGVAGFLSGRRAPSLLNLGWEQNLMWDGRARDLRSQVALPLESPEMAVDWPNAIARLQNDPTIANAFAQAGIAAIGRDVVLDALATFVGSLQAGRSRFDRYFYDRDAAALTQNEMLGFRLFTHKARCNNCHVLSGLSTTFTDNAFHTMGIGCRGAVCSDPGRAAITGAPSDQGAFKTPGLRGVALRPYLMHDGSITSLKAAVERYNFGIEAGPTDRLGPLYLTAEEVDAIVSFLCALTPEDSEIRKQENSFSEQGEIKQ